MAVSLPGVGPRAGRSKTRPVTDRPEINGILDVTGPSVDRSCTNPWATLVASGIRRPSSRGSVLPGGRDVRTSAVQAARPGAIAQSPAPPLARAETVARAGSSARPKTARDTVDAHAAALFGLPKPGLLLGGDGSIGLFLAKVGHPLLNRRAVLNSLVRGERPSVARLIPEGTRGRSAWGRRRSLGHQKGCRAHEQ